MTSFVSFTKRRGLLAQSLAGGAHICVTKPSGPTQTAHRDAPTFAAADITRLRRGVSLVKRLGAAIFVCCATLYHDAAGTALRGSLRACFVLQSEGNLTYTLAYEHYLS